MKLVCIVLGCFGFGLIGNSAISKVLPLGYKVALIIVGAAFVAAALVLKHRYLAPREDQND
jgi:hypothetical protein